MSKNIDYYSDYIFTRDLIEDSMEISIIDRSRMKDIEADLEDIYSRPGWDPEDVALDLTIWQPWEYYPLCSKNVSDKITSNLSRSTALQFDNTDRRSQLLRLRGLQEKLLEYRPVDLPEADLIAKLIIADELSIEYQERSRQESDAGMSLAYASAAANWSKQYRKFYDTFMSQRDQTKRQKTNEYRLEQKWRRDDEAREAEMKNNKREIFSMLQRHERQYSKIYHLLKGRDGEDEIKSRLEHSRKSLADFRKHFTKEELEVLDQVQSEAE